MRNSNNIVAGDLLKKLWERRLQLNIQPNLETNSSNGLIS